MALAYEYLAIEGNIGAGKTTLANKISAHYDTRLVLEEFAENPFLPKFYAQPDRYAFPLELSFLSERFAQLKAVLNSRDLFRPHIVADYFLSKSLIFARATLKGDELNLFLQLYDIMQPNLPQPDLLVYLYKDTSSLQSNIRKRGRSYEQQIPDSYLEKVQDSYLDYIRTRTNMRVLVLETSGVDFVKNPADFEHVCTLLEQEYPTGVTRIRLKD